MTDELDEILKGLQDDTDIQPKLSLVVPQKSAEIKVDLDQDDISKEMVIKFRERFDKMRSREEEDRRSLKNAISFLEGLVFNKSEPKTGHVEQLVAAYRVLIDSNVNAVRALDALSKLLSAGKGTNVLVQNNVNQSTPQQEVMKLLEDDNDYEQ